MKLPVGAMAITIPMTMTKSMTMAMKDTMIVTTTMSVMTMTARDKRVDSVMGASNKHKKIHALRKAFKSLPPIGNRLASLWLITVNAFINFNNHAEFKRSQMHTYIHACMPTYIRTCVRTRTHTHMRAHRLEQHRTYNAACAWRTGHLAPALFP